ncbi:MAG: hypothetical protein U0641_03410 [Anaerolineae bacterium]
MSVFPTTQSVRGPWTDAYHRAGITPTTAPNDGQPKGVHVSVSVRRPRAAPPLVTAGQGRLDAGCPQPRPRAADRRDARYRRERRA